MVSYINTSVEVKAQSDILCTSRNAVQVVNSIPAEKPILFLPDVNLGNYVKKQTGRENMKIWQGACIVHATFPAPPVGEARAEHPEGNGGRPSGMPAERAGHGGFHRFHIGHHRVVRHAARPRVHRRHGERRDALAPQRRARTRRSTSSGMSSAIAASARTCGRNTLEKLRDCLLNLEPRVELPAEIMRRARVPIERMLAYASSVAMARSADRYLRPPARQPAHQRHRPLQHPLLLLHAGGRRAVRPPRGDPVVRGDRAVRARRGARWASARSASPAASRCCGATCRCLIRRLAAIPGIARSRADHQWRASRPPRAGRCMRPVCGVSTYTLTPWTASAFSRSRAATSSTEVLAGIVEAKRLGFRIKINAVAVKNLVEPDIVPLARFGREHGFEIRYIEFMPLDAQGLWDRDKVLLADEIVAILSREVCAARTGARPRPARAGPRIPIYGWQRDESVSSRP